MVPASLDCLDLVTLRHDQTRAIDGLRDGIRQDHKRQLLAAPTGSGKTEVAKHMIASAWAKGNRALFLVDRLTLLDQTSRRFYESGIEHGVWGGGSTRGLAQPIVVATKQALARLPEQELLTFLNSFDVTFDDECHVTFKALSEAYVKLDQKQLIGLTATPLTRGLGNVYENLVSVTTTNQLLEKGELSPLLIRTAVEIDMTGAPITRGEWSASTVQERSRKIVGDIPSTWVEETNRTFGGPVKTMLFAASIPHGDELCEAFQAAGIDARQVSAHDATDDRQRKVQGFRHGEYPIIVSCEVMSRGVDIPDVQCLAIARPYRKAFAAHIQMLGRGMRKAEGKTQCLVIDYSGNCLGFYHETEHFFEHGADRLDSQRFRNVKRAEQLPRDLSCKGCKTVLPPKTQVCPVCGMERKRRSTDVVNVPGTMITIEPLSKGKRAWTGTEAELWSACCTAAQKFQERKGNWDDHGKTERQAKAHFHDLTGRWPPRQYQFLPGDYVPKAIDRALAAKRRAWRKKQQEQAA